MSNKGLTNLISTAEKGTALIFIDFQNHIQGNVV